MPGTGLMPNGISSGADEVVYLVVDKVGSPRDARCKTKVERTDIETIISDLIAGQFNDPLRVVAFNTLGHWSNDVSTDLANEIQARCDIEAMPVPEHIRDFVLSYTGEAGFPASAHSLRQRCEWRCQERITFCWGPRSPDH